MMNNFVIVGKLKNFENEYMNLICNFKNENGLYEKCDVSIKLTYNILKNSKDYLKTDDLVGVKGIIGNNNILIADKITFLSKE